MPGFLEIGPNYGQAAPGERQVDVLATARGDTFVRDSSGLVVPLHVANQGGKFIGTDGTDATYRFPPGYLQARDTGGAGTPLNTTGETTVLNALLAVTSVASTGIFTKTAHGLTAGQLVTPTANILDSFLTLNAPYYVSATNLAANTFSLSTTSGGAVLTGTTNDTNLSINTSMVSALPAFVAAGDRVQVHVDGISVFGSGTGTQLFNLYAGATKIVAGAVSGNVGTTARAWELDFMIEYLSSTSIKVSGQMLLRGPASAGWGQMVAIADVQIPGNDLGAVTISALPQNIDVKAVCSISTATTQVTCKGATATYFPKNY